MPRAENEGQQGVPPKAGGTRSPSPFDRQAPVKGVKYVVAVGSGKGGVGKSTVAVNLAVALKMCGARVGLLDADLYGPSLPRMMGCLRQKPDMDPSSRKIYPLSRYGIKIMSMGFLVEEEAPVIWRGPMLFKAVDQFLKDVDWGGFRLFGGRFTTGNGGCGINFSSKDVCVWWNCCVYTTKYCFSGCKKSFKYVETIKNSLFRCCRKYVFF